MAKYYLAHKGFKIIVIFLLYSDKKQYSTSTSQLTKKMQLERYYPTEIFFRNLYNHFPVCGTSSLDYSDFGYINNTLIVFDPHFPHLEKAWEILLPVSQLKRGNSLSYHEHGNLEVIINKYCGADMHVSF